MGFKEDLNPLEARTYPFMKGRFKKLVYTVPQGQHSLELARIPGAGLVVGLALGHQEEEKAD